MLVIRPKKAQQEQDGRRPCSHDRQNEQRRAERRESASKTDGNDGEKRLRAFLLVLTVSLQTSREHNAPEVNSSEKILERPVMLKIGVVYNSTAATLANLGLPPNRQPGNTGFMVHETDGRYYPAAQSGCGHIHAGEWENDLTLAHKVIGA